MSRETVTAPSRVTARCRRSHPQLARGLHPARPVLRVLGGVGSWFCAQGAAQGTGRPVHVVMSSGSAMALDSGCGSRHGLGKVR